MLPNKLKSITFDTLSNITGRYIKPEPYHKATGLVAKVYEQVVEEFFINGAITTHAACPPLLAGMWIGGRELVLTDDHLTREDKEAIGVTFAQLNNCTYCEELMNSVVYGASMTDLANRIRYREQADIEDDRTRRLHEWALSSYTPAAPILHQPPFTAEEAPEVIGTALMFHYLNRYVKVFFDGTPLNVPFSSESIKSVLFHGFGIELRESVSRRLQPGRANALLPEAELPADLYWASSNPNIASAVSRWAATVETEGQSLVPARTREIVRDVVAQWRGEPMGISRSWLEPHLTALSEAEAAATRLALLAALSPVQMSDDIIEDFRKYFDDDAALVATVAWSAFSASRRITGWLADVSGYYHERTGNVVNF